MEHRSFDFMENRTAKSLYLVHVGRDDGFVSMEQLQSFCIAYFPGVQVKIMPPLTIDATEDRMAVSYVKRTRRGPVNAIMELKSRRCHRYGLLHFHFRLMPTDKDKVPESHRQFAVDPLLNVLTHMLPDDGICLLALTMEDLYEGSTDSFCVGMAAGGSGAGIFSLCRYDPNFNSTEPSSLDRDRILLARSCKVMVHELAHMFGIDHCTFFQWYLDFNQDLTMQLHERIGSSWRGFLAAIASLSHRSSQSSDIHRMRSWGSISTSAKILQETRIRCRVWMGHQEIASMQVVKRRKGIEFRWMKIFNLKWHSTWIQLENMLFLLNCEIISDKTKHKFRQSLFQHFQILHFKISQYHNLEFQENRRIWIIIPDVDLTKNGQSNDR